MRILIADDHDLVRETLVAFLEQEDGFTLTSASDLDTALAAIGAQGPFDLVLLDYGMPGMDGLAGLDRARTANGPGPVAIISGVADRAIAQEALDRGAAGFLPKTMTSKSMVNAVRFMAAGEQFAPLAFMTAEEPQAENPLAARLSTREREVLAGLCAGKSNKEIARDLDLQEVTIKLHVKTLCRKLEARNRTHAAMIAKEAGIS
ncbi:MAG: response regulator transcription factor [Pseudomonadota bacterium]